MAVTCLKWREPSGSAQIFDQRVMERSMQHDLVSELNFDALTVPCYVSGAQFGLGPMPQDMRCPPDLIFIPQELRGQTIAGFPIPGRLADLPEDKGIRLFGQLHGLSFYLRLNDTRNCGLKTFREIRELVQMIQ